MTLFGKVISTIAPFFIDKNQYTPVLIAAREPLCDHCCAWVCASGRAARVSGQLLGVRRASPGLSNMTNANRFTNADTLCILSYTAPDCALAGMIYGKPALRLRSRYSAVNLYVQAALMQASCAESDFDNFCSG